MLLFCPHCDDIIEILGEPLPRPMPECEHCGGVLEAMDGEARFELTPEGVAVLVGQGH